MRKQGIALLLTIFAIHAKSQPCICTYPFPETTHPDTITFYDFIDTTVLIKNIPSAHPISSVGFKTKNFSLQWLPVSSTDIHSFIERSFESMHITTMIDSSDIKIFQQDYRTLSFLNGNKTNLFFYRQKKGDQVFYWVVLRNKEFIQKTLDFISKYLR